MLLNGIHTKSRIRTDPTALIPPTKMNSWFSGLGSKNKNEPIVTPGYIPVEVFKAGIFLEAEKNDDKHLKDIKKFGWMKAKHKFPQDLEAQQKFAEKWIDEQTKMLDESRLKVSDYFQKK
jgi:hypothetical protein